MNFAYSDKQRAQDVFEFKHNRKSTRFKEEQDNNDW